MFEKAAPNRTFVCIYCISVKLNLLYTWLGFPFLILAPFFAEERVGVFRVYLAWLKKEIVAASLAFDLSIKTSSIIPQIISASADYRRGRMTEWIADSE